MAQYIRIIFACAESALVGRLAATPGGTDYQAYYDTDADLTSLADTNGGQMIKESKLVKTA